MGAYGFRMIQRHTNHSSHCSLKYRAIFLAVLGGFVGLLRADCVPFADQALTVTGKINPHHEIVDDTNPIFTNSSDTVYISGTITTGSNWNFQDSNNQIAFITDGTVKGFSFGPPFSSQQWGIFDGGLNDKGHVYNHTEGDTGEPSPTIGPGQTVEVVFSIKAQTGETALYVNPDLSRTADANPIAIKATLSQPNIFGHIKSISICGTSNGDYAYSKFKMYNGGQSPFGADATAAQAPTSTPTPSPAPSPANPAHPEAKSYKDLTYKTVDGKPLTLDLYVPDNGGGPVPLIIAIHGGGWHAGQKTDYPSAPFIKNGYAMASIEYRLAPEAIFPAQAEDVKAAVRWLRTHAKDYNLDPDRFGAFGHSAGGHLASLLGTTGNMPQFDVGDNLGVSSKVQAVVDMAGPVAFLALAPNKMAGEPGLIGGTVEEKHDLAALASPITHITSDDPPFLILHGDNDHMVPEEQALLFYAALQKANVPCQLLLLPKVDHGINLDLPYGKGSLWDGIFRFLDGVLKKAG